MTRLDQAEWVALYTELEKPLYNVVYRIVFDAMESQDLVQDAFLRCWRRRDTVRREGVRSLLYRTAINLALNRRRRDRLWHFVGLDAAETNRPGHDGNEHTLPRSVREALQKLPNRLKLVLLLTEYAGMTYAETGATLGIKDGTVASRRARALARIRNRLGCEEPGNE